MFYNFLRWFCHLRIVIDIVLDNEDDGLGLRPPFVSYQREFPRQLASIKSSASTSNACLLSGVVSALGGAMSLVRRAFCMVFRGEDDGKGLRVPLVVYQRGFVRKVTAGV